MQLLKPFFLQFTTMKEVGEMLINYFVKSASYKLALLLILWCSFKVDSIRPNWRGGSLLLSTIIKLSV